MSILLLDGTLKIEIFFECEDHDLDDNICVSIMEDCPTAEQLLRADETHVYLTPQEARALGNALLAAAEHSQDALQP